MSAVQRFNRRKTYRIVVLVWLKGKKRRGNPLWSAKKWIQLWPKFLLPWNVVDVRCSCIDRTLSSWVSRRYRTFSKQSTTWKARRSRLWIFFLVPVPLGCVGRVSQSQKESLAKQSFPFWLPEHLKHKTCVVCFLSVLLEITIPRRLRRD